MEAMKWQFEEGPSGCDVWVDYLPTDSAKVEAAYKRKSETVAITNRFGTYNISALQSSTPSQQNSSTNAIRRIRRVLGLAQRPPDDPVRRLTFASAHAEGQWLGASALA